MKDSQCPKCDETVRPTWHASCAKGSVYVKATVVSASPKEHLHYFCKCGYDFIRDVYQEEG